MIKETTEENQVAKRMKSVIKGNVVEVKISRPRRIFVYVRKNAFRKAVKYLKEREGFTHISTITAADLGEEIEIIYHLSHDGRIELSLKVRVPKDKPALPSITDLLPGAILYEREVHDLLGVTFEGHPDLSPLVLPEGWPPGICPLRKEWTIEKIRDEILRKEGK